MNFVSTTFSDPVLHFVFRNVLVKFSQTLYLNVMELNTKLAHHPEYYVSCKNDAFFLACLPLR